MMSQAYLAACIATLRSVGRCYLSWPVNPANAEGCRVAYFAGGKLGRLFTSEGGKVEVRW